MPPGQSFEMTQKKPVSLILKLRRANNFVINVIVYSEYDSEVEMLNNRKLICHEYALKNMQKIKEISLAHYQGVHDPGSRNCAVFMSYTCIIFYHKPK